MTACIRYLHSSTKPNCRHQKNIFIMTRVVAHATFVKPSFSSKPSLPSSRSDFNGICIVVPSQTQREVGAESLLDRRGVNWTSIRPVYIYGPLNYNPVEEWFFHRLKAGRPIPIPNSGLQVTQVGHVKDLARAFVSVLGNEKASKQVYNIFGSKYVTFDGLARACAKEGGFPEPEIVHYNPKDYDFGKKKAFPFRDQHFFASIEKATRELGWTPEFGLVEGLADSYNLDFGRGTYRKAADFSTDDIILNRSLVLQS